MSPIEARLKRALDVLLAGSALAAGWPVIALIGVVVKVNSPGPALYLGERAGLQGKPFRILKFRTMVVDAESLGGTTTALNDPRLTSIGATLRKYKLDELPQVINVLKGEMSLVGPRPEVYEYVDQYDFEERQILDVRPGITDLASIELVDLASVVGSDDADEAYRQNVLKRKNQLRLQYVREQSLRTDARILAKTLSTLVRRTVGSPNDRDV